MIVVSRTGELLHADPLTEQQQEDALFAVVEAFCELNPEFIREEVERYLAETGGTP